MNEELELEAAVPKAVEGDREAARTVVRGVQDDVYGLAVRMLGDCATAEDASQEILLQVLTHLAQWRGEARFRTWVYRIAVRHLTRVKRTTIEEKLSFETIEGLIARGAANPPLPELAEGELTVLEREVRLTCTEGMLLSLDRDQRIAWILAHVFELDSGQAATVLDVDAATYRKRLQRARDRLGAWMGEHCGLVDATNGCNCRRQIPVAMSFAGMTLDTVRFARHPERAREVPRRRRLEILEEEAAGLAVYAGVLCAHPEYAAPESLLAKIRDLVESHSLQILDS
jgi:RNA polymerase sigma factor (sigma-70 family)